MNKSDCIVIIPTYNEKENVEKIIRAVFSLEKAFHILIIDDGSPDGTAAIVHRLMDEEFADRLSDVSWNRGDVFGAAHALSAVGLSAVRQPVLCDVSKTVGSLTAMGLVWPAADVCLERFLTFLKSSR